MLHTLNCAPGNTRFEDCLRLLGPDDALLLTGDGCYAALARSDAAARLEASKVSLYLIEEDASARGLVDRLLGSVELIDYAGFVALSEAHPRQLAWY